MAPLYGWGSTASRLYSHYEEAVYFLTLSSQKFSVLIWSTTEGWKAELTLEPPIGFEHRNSYFKTTPYFANLSLFMGKIWTPSLGKFRKLKRLLYKGEGAFQLWVTPSSVSFAGVGFTRDLVVLEVYWKKKNLNVKNVQINKEAYQRIV